MSEVPRKTYPPEFEDVPSAADTTGRESGEDADMSELLVHLLDCRASSDERERGEAGVESVRAGATEGNAFLLKAAREAVAAGEAESIEQWYRGHGITSRRQLRRIWKHESSPNPGLMLHNGRTRTNIEDALYLSGLLDTEDDAW